MPQKCFITNDKISHLEMLGSQTFNYFTLYAISKKTGHDVAISTAPHQFQGLLPQCFDLPLSLTSFYSIDHHNFQFRRDDYLPMD